MKLLEYPVRNFKINQESALEEGKISIEKHEKNEMTLFIFRNKAL